MFKKGMRCSIIGLFLDYKTQTFWEHFKTFFRGFLGSVFAQFFHKNVEKIVAQQKSFLTSNDHFNEIIRIQLRNFGTIIGQKYPDFR